MSRTNKSTRLERNQAIANGLRSLPSKTMIPMKGRLVRASEAAEVFDKGTETQKEASAARAKYFQTVATAHAAEAALRALIEPIKSYVQNTFGERSSTAAAFGFRPRKRTRLSAEVRYEAVAKLRATRAARGTLGPRRKPKIHMHVEIPADAHVIGTTVPPVDASN